MNIVHEVFQDDKVKHLADITGIGIVIAAWSDYLPTIATTLSIVWFALRIWETDTVKGWTGRLRKGDKQYDRNHED